MSNQPRTVLITGVAGGIGRATAQYFSDQGWRVIGIDRAPFDDVFPENGTFLQADISRESDWDEIFTRVRQETDSLTALVNNAAVQITKPILETSIEEWDLVMDANLKAVFVSAKLAYPLLKAGNGGAIVNVSSVHAVATSKDIAAYAASKGGMLALTRAMAIEFAVDHIRVNAILPGAVDTPMLRAGMNRDHAGEGNLKQRLENLAMKTVSGKIGEASEIARVIYFLADDSQSSFITGQPVIVDGGATARLSTE